MEKEILSIRYISSRTLQVTFCGNPKTNIIVSYASTNVSDEEVKNYYHQLAAATKSVPAHNVTIVAGNFNTRIGLDNAKFAYQTSTNRNGEFLHEYEQENDLVITNTTFKKKTSKLWTCVLPSGVRAQLDYVLIKKKLRNSVNDAEAYNSFARLGSDQKIVTAKIRLSLWADCRTTPEKFKYDWSKLATDQDLQHRYTLEIRNRYSILAEKYDWDQSQKYKYLIQANKETAEKIMPKLPEEVEKSTLL